METVAGPLSDLSLTRPSFYADPAQIALPGAAEPREGGREARWYKNCPSLLLRERNNGWQRTTQSTMRRYGGVRHDSRPGSNSPDRSVQMHQTHDLLVLAAPMPGAEPEIAVTIRGDHLTICGEYRGSRHDQPEILLSEWTVGPYYREVSPATARGWRVDQCNLWQRRAGPVHAEAGTWSAGESYRVPTSALTNTRGQRVGYTGAHMEPTPTQARSQHRAQANRPTDQP